ncbi:hypothetical protein HPB50_015898 [Hyalomma asiaticum]|uniref:Uncharacterized protein n=1 Tax=Hyalomma asiaticum TaxID=266040 RepID=A0ACB7SFY3_HYAAI|nr:hypothetical protein HPB50_015898 [Hyalomma asiaticum]
MPVHEQEAKYAAISAQHGAPVYRSGQAQQRASTANGQATWLPGALRVNTFQTTPIPTRLPCLA